jgi:hypothetical protein
MEPSAEDDLVLSLTIEHLKEFGEWPKLQDLHQRIHQDLHLRADVQTSARRLAPQPFVGGGFSNLGETFAPPLDVVARSVEGRRLLECLVDFIKLARDKYESSRGQPEVTSDELQEKLGIDHRTARALRELARVPWVTDGSSSNAGKWSVTVAHEITRWDGLVDGDDLLSRLDQIRAKDERHLAALTRSKHRISGREAWDADEEYVEESRGKRWDTWASYLETHPAIRILAVLGIPIAVVAAIITLLKG